MFLRNSGLMEGIPGSGMNFCIPSSSATVTPGIGSDEESFLFGVAGTPARGIVGTAGILPVSADCFPGVLPIGLIVKSLLSSGIRTSQGLLKIIGRLSPSYYYKIFFTADNQPTSRN